MRLAFAAGVSTHTVIRLENGQTKNDRGHAVQAVLKFLGIQTAPPTMLMSQRGMMLAMDALDQNVDFTTANGEPDEFAITLEVAAKHWVELDDTAGYFNGRPMHGRFSMRIAGACMEPFWLDGETVSFLMLDGPESEFRAGKDYLIIRNRGGTVEGTFKRCVEIGDDTITVATSNPAEQRIWVVERNTIVRAARALYAHVDRTGGKQ